MPIKIRKYILPNEKTKEGNNSECLPPLDKKKKLIYIKKNDNFKIQETNKTINTEELKTAIDFIEFLNQEYPNTKILGFEINNKKYSKNHNPGTKTNEIFTDDRNIITLTGSPKPPDTPPPQNKARNPPKPQNVKKEIKCDQYTLCFIDYSKSTSSSFEKNIPTNQSAIDIMNNFMQARLDFCFSDPAFIFEIEEKSFQPYYKEKIDYQPKLIQCQNSTIFDMISLSIQFLKGKNSYLPKQIFLISDCKSDTIKSDQIVELCNNLLSEDIILDLIIIQNANDKNKKNQLLNDICAISHLTGGVFLCCQSKQEAIQFSESEKLLNISNRPFSNINNKSRISKTVFEKVSKSMHSVNLNEKRCSFYKNIELISPFYQNELSSKPENKEVKRQIELCLGYQQKKSEKSDKKPFFAMYYLFDKIKKKIDTKKLMVFINGKSNQKKILYQILILFPDDFPKTNPSFFIISEIILDCCKSNGFIKFDINKKNNSLLQMLYNISQKLISNKDVQKRNNILDPIDSFDQIESIFRVCYGKKQKIIEVDEDELIICK